MISRSVIAYFLISLLGLFLPSTSLAEEETIIVKGYGYGRTRYALVDANGNIPANPLFHADRLYNGLQSKFGEGKLVSCPVELQPTTDYVSKESLVDLDGNLKADVFWAPALNTELSEEEAEELGKFVRSGGILYVGGGSWLTPTQGMGPEINLLFENLGIDDHFDTSVLTTEGVRQSHVPLESIVVNGPFGNVGQLYHGAYRKFEAHLLRPIVPTDEFGSIVSESMVGDGYLIVVGDTLYSNFFMQDVDNFNYYMNLFALGCGDQDFTLYEKITLETPSFKQGLFEYDGLDPIWENEIYDHGDQQNLWCGQTMAECACALTSATMVIRYNNIDKLWYNEDIDPKSVNSYFKQFSKLKGDHYESYGFSDGNILWSAVSGLTADSNTVHGTPKLDLPKREDFNLEKIKQYIDEGIPVIQQVTGSFGAHWVMIKGYEPSTGRLIINDPARPDPSTGRYAYLDELYSPKAANSMITYVKTYSDFRYLEFNSPSPQHFLVTDQNGNKTGYDADLGVIFQEIPNSRYVFEESYGDATGRRAKPPADAGINVLTIQLPMDGQYILQTTGDVSPLAISVHSSDRAGKKAFDFVIPESDAFYSVAYDEATAGQEVEISELVKKIQVQIDIEPFVKNNIVIPVNWLPVPVAILASSTFDLAEIDRASLTFGKTGGEESLIGCASKLLDVNRDKVKDLVCYFLGSKTNLETSDTEAILDGKSEDGLIFEGKDKVNVLKPWFMF